MVRCRCRCARAALRVPLEAVSGCDGAARGLLTPAVMVDYWKLRYDALSSKVWAMIVRYSIGV